MLFKGNTRCLVRESCETRKILCVLTSEFLILKSDGTYTYHDDAMR
jgi:hypothetical protein